MKVVTPQEFIDEMNRLGIQTNPDCFNYLCSAKDCLGLQKKCPLMSQKENLEGVL